MRLVSALLFAAAAAAQPGPHFEVASLKPTQADPQAIGTVRPAPGNQGYIGSNMTLRSYLMIAFVVRDTQIVGAPAWFGNDRYWASHILELREQLAALDEPALVLY